MKLVAIKSFGRDITKGNTYSLIKEMFNGYVLKDDNGDKYNYPKAIFRGCASKKSKQNHKEDKVEMIAVKNFGNKVSEGKIYEVLREKSNGYLIKDEEGETLWYPKSLFEELEEEIELDEGEITEEELKETPKEEEESDEY